MEILKLLTHRFIGSLAKIFKTSFPEKNIKICYKNRLPYLTKALRKSIEKKTHTEICIPEESYSGK